jgi:hypothetical protein
MNIFIFLLLLCLLTLVVISKNDESTLNELKNLQSQLNSKTTPFCYGTGHSGSKQAFNTNKYGQYIGDLPILVYPFCLVTQELGNRLGNLFHEITCAEASGMHFLAIHNQWDITGSHNGNYSVKNSTDIPDVQKLAFLNALPTIIEHKEPLERRKAMSKIHHECKCTRYCWNESNAPWVNRTSTIRHYLKIAIAAYLNAIDEKQKFTTLIDTDLTNSKPNEVLPLVPDVTIQYRCGDNIAFNYMYGILPFYAFDSRIPKNSKYIYVLSDHPTRAVHSPYTTRCQTILQALFDYLKEKNPSSTIVVKRGGDLFLDYIRLSSSNVTICSASSYCFWPAIANTNTAYFPVTSLIAGADNINLAPNFGPNFHWIAEPEIISSFKNFRPWTTVLDVLRGIKKNQ